MRRTPLTRTAFVLLAVVTLSFVNTAASMWHLHLTDSFPKADAVLSEAPDSIRLWFNQEPELSLTAISLEGENGALDVGSVLETDDTKSLKVEVVGVLGSGSYTVAWRVAGDDGHAVRGRYDFEVRTGTSLNVPVER